MLPSPAPADRGEGGVGGVLVLDQLLLRLELPPTLAALVAVPVEDGGADHV